VGKSSLLTQYVEDDFHDVFISTIGIDFRNKNLEVLGRKVKVRIWDTAGQERFKTLTGKFYRGSHGILMLYDMTNRESFNNVDKWMQQIKDNIGDTNPCIVLVANKKDLEDSRVITQTEGKRLARKYGIPYFETSARTDTGVNDAFQALAEAVVKKYINEEKGSGADSKQSRSSNERRKSGGSTSRTESKKVDLNASSNSSDGSGNASSSGCSC
jgi:small GTP-binding protein